MNTPRPTRRRTVLAAAAGLALPFLARAQGFTVSKGEVEPGAHGLAVLIHQGGEVPSACLNLITYRDDVMARAAPFMLEGATRISRLLG